ncbi:hypothetical protein HERIO_1612 [Hepatospora eriocheir]|uniref:Poly(A) polymerase RNA-binding domain-containing protein n=1 Tax=Hepatospora eriocheir TaxID=1081669 RepID=A0A1X0Q9L9_9MICR|nr:hypothetical protein HERIO_1612 [Hepatospora eriocheir]
MDDKSYKLWHGFIESKIRVLATKLETIGDIEGAIPLPKAFKIDNTSTFFIGIDVLKFKNTTRRVFGDIPVREFIEFVCEWSEKSSDMKIEINTAKRHDIKEFLRNYLKK